MRREKLFRVPEPQNSHRIIRVKAKAVPVVEAHRVVRGRGFHIV
jgi:hypothetical protein